MALNIAQQKFTLIFAIRGKIICNLRKILTVSKLYLLSHVVRPSTEYNMDPLAVFR